jgi:ParB family chromosome partitioning protein
MSNLMAQRSDSAFASVSIPILSLARDRPGGNGHALGEPAASTATQVVERINPSMARVWSRHHRDPAMLNEHNCADLISSFRARGQQEIPAIVREVSDDQSHQYEIICGVRRHWAASWLKAHGSPEFMLLVEVRKLNDEEAFLLSDMDSRTRRDISDYERACDYARSLEWYYDGNQQRMAERLKVSKSWLSRFLELAKLPPDVVGAFGSADLIGIAHGAVLAPLLRVPRTRQRILEAASALKVEQTELYANTGARIGPPAVIQRLVTASRKQKTSRGGSQAKEHVIRAKDGAILALGVKASRGGAATIRFPAPAKHNKADLLVAAGDLLEWFGSSNALTVDG